MSWSPANKRPAQVGLLLVALFYGAALPLILGDHERGRGAADEARFHRPVIELWASAMGDGRSGTGGAPGIHLSDYGAATTPGYHLALAAVFRACGGNLRVTRLAGSLFAAALLFLLAREAARRLRPLAGFFVALPAACSIYVFSSGVWLLPDDAGWLGVLAILIFSARRRWGRLDPLAGGALLLATVAVRQSHLWCAVPLWVSGWFAKSETWENADARPGSGAIQARGKELTRRRATRAGAMLAGTLPAFGLVFWFYRLWGGFTPPMFQAGAAGEYAANQGINPSAIPLLFAIFGTAGMFFAAPRLLYNLVDDPGRKAGRGCGEAASGASGLSGGKKAVLAGLGLGLLAGVLPPTSYAPPARWSGLWTAARLLPSFGERSPAMILLAAWGGVMLALFARALREDRRWLFLFAFAAFAAAATAGRMAWERYSEPFVLLLLVLACGWMNEGDGTLGIDEAEGTGPGPQRGAAMRSGTPGPRRPLSVIGGPLLLAALLALVTMVNLR